MKSHSIFNGLLLFVSISLLFLFSGCSDETYTHTGGGDPFPSLTITSPDGVSDKADTSFLIQWTDSDYDSDAQISLFYDYGDFGEDGSPIVSGISEDSTTDSFSWDTTGMAQDDVVYIYGIIDDGENPPVCAYSSGPVTISHDPADNTSPSITILEPDSAENSDTTFVIRWTDSDPDDNALISLYYDTDNTGFDGIEIDSDIEEDSTVDTYTWDVSALAEDVYYVYAVIDDGVNPPVSVYSSGTVSTIPPQGILKWSSNLDYRGYYPTIGNDGIIYAITIDQTTHTPMARCAINPDGSEKWTYALSLSSFDSVGFPVAVSDNTVYFADTNRITAVNQNGTLKWHFSKSFNYAHSPAVASDGTLYAIFGSGTSEQKSTLYSINTAGVENWHYTITGSQSTLPSIGKDGTIYFSSGNHNLYAINPDGSVKWTCDTGFYNWHWPVIDSDGIIYLTSTTISAVNPDGTLKWQFTPEFGPQSEPVIDSNGTLYFSAWNASTQCRLYALNQDGSVKWTYTTSEDIFCTPAIGKDNTIFFCSSSDFKAFAPDGSEKWNLPGLGFFTSPAIAPDGTVYISGYDNKIHALQTGCGGPADSVWPMYRGNAQHTGEAQ